jgi:hypothetical protein
MPRRGTALVSLCVVVAMLALAGCGRDDFENNPRPPVPAEITVKIGNGAVAVSPREFGSGLVNFTVANLTTDPATLVIHGPVDATSPEVQPSKAETVKVEMKTGSYEASADGVAVRPQQFTVGPERPSGQNDLLLP